MQAGELHDAEETTLPNSRYSTWGHSVSKASPKRGSCGNERSILAVSDADAHDVGELHAAPMCSSRRASLSTENYFSSMGALQ